MKYRNKVNGRVIDISAEMHDERWEPVTAPAVSAEKKEEKPKRRRTQRKAG